MSTKLVYANCTTAATNADGIPIRVAANEPWAADDPFVKFRPELFSDEPPMARRTVEQTTAAPGERR